jgi:hypothetical protein
LFGNAVLVLVFILLVILFWLDGARARELATALARELCQRHEVQFLDGSAALASLGLRATSAGLRILRIFSFSFYSDEVGRRQGEVVLIGGRLMAVRLGGHTVWMAEPGRD